MAKGQHLSRYQQGIVRRHYDHADSQTAMKLQELVSELYLAADNKKRTKLWDKAGDLLAKAGANQARIDKVMTERSPEALAALVNELTAPRK
jgi:hypothetical protein